MPRATRQRIICQHCGNHGHVSNLCPRTSYSPTLPAWSCSNCLKQIVSCTTADPIQFDIKVKIVNCAAHKTTTAKPTARQPLAAAPAPGPVAAAPQPAANPAPGPVAAAPQPAANPAPGPVAAAPQPAANPAQRNRLILQRRGRRTRCQVPLQLITDTYNAVSENVQHTGCGLYESLDNNNVKRGYWRGIRPVAEAMLVDPGRY